MDDGVVLLDLHEIDGVTEAGRLERIPGVTPQRGHLRELGAIALEMPVVDGVEAGQRGEQPDVGLVDGVADQVAL